MNTKRCGACIADYFCYEGGRFLKSYVLDLNRCIKTFFIKRRKCLV